MQNIVKYVSKKNAFTQKPDSQEILKMNTNTSGAFEWVNSI